MDIITKKSFKYYHEKLDSTSEEFKFLEGFFDKSTNGDSLGRFTLNEFQIFKVKENIPNKAVNVNYNNLMLFHGTSEKGATGIFKEGFKNSERGWFGQGVYMTDCSDVAFDYSSNYYNWNCSRSLIYIFVNEILESEKLQTFKFESTLYMNDNYDELEHQFIKHMHYNSPPLTKKNYKVDLLGRKYRNVKVDDNSLTDEYVADESITIPRYLIVFKIEWKTRLSSSYKLVFIKVIKLVAILLIAYYFKMLFLV